MNDEGDSAPAEGSVTLWVNSLRHNIGGCEAARQLWDRYFARLVSLARRELGKAPRPAGYDAEDVALSAFDVFCRGAQAGQYDTIANRDELWRLLVVVTLRKANDRAKGEQALKRGGRKVVHQNLGAAANVVSCDLDPETSAIMAEECRRLLEALDNEQLEQVALMKLDGFQNTEIADQMGCTRQTVQRRLRLIREIWEAA